MKKILFLIISVTLMCILCSCGGDEKYNHLEFYPQDDGKYHVGLADSVNREEITDLADVEIPVFYKGRLVDGIAGRGFSGCKNLTEFNLPSHIVEIDDAAFENCGFESLTIPMHIKKLGYHAFSSCHKLTSVDFKGLTTEIESGVFISCISLTDVKLPAGLREISTTVFEFCTALEKIEIPRGVRSIGGAAFRYCENLKGINLPDGLLEIGDQVFSGCIAITEISIPDSVIHLGKDAFKDCSSLTKAHFGGPEVITMDEVNSMRELTHVSFGEGVKEIGNLCFTNAKKLESVTLPSGIRSIARAFTWSVALQYHSYGGGFYLGNEENPYIYLIASNGVSELDIHPDTKIINDEAIATCGNLTEIILPDGIRSVVGIDLSSAVPELLNEYKGGYYLGTRDNPYHLMYGTVYGADDSVEIHPDTVIISTNALSTWHNLSHLHIPAKVSSIIPVISRHANNLTEITVDPENKHFKSEDGVLYSADGKTLICYPKMKEGDSFDIPIGVNTIAPYAFHSAQITNISIGGDVKEIGNYAFYGCEKLERFTLHKTVSLIGGSILNSAVACDVIFVGDEKDLDKIIIFLDNYYLYPEEVLFVK